MKRVTCTLYSTWCIMICLVIPILSLLLFIHPYIPFLNCTFFHLLVLYIFLYGRCTYRIFLNVSTRFYFTVTSRHFTGHTLIIDIIDYVYTYTGLETDDVTRTGCVTGVCLLEHGQSGCILAGEAILQKCQ